MSVLNSIRNPDTLNNKKVRTLTFVALTFYQLQHICLLLYKCKVNKELQYHGDDSACSSSDTESTPTSPRLARKSQSCNKLSPTTAGISFQNNHLSPGMSPRNSPWSSPRASPCSTRKSPHSLHLWNVVEEKSPISSTQFLRILEEFCSGDKQTYCWIIQAAEPCVLKNSL